MSTVERTWRRDFANASQALEDGGWVAEGHDGEERFNYLRSDAPPSLVRVYRGLLSVGYARGWLA